MITRSHTLPLTGLRAVHNARTRIYAAGRDPMFTAFSRPKQTIRVVPAFSDDEPADAARSTLWRPDVIDRLKTPLTRHRD